jgi:hypothetical protein
MSMRVSARERDLLSFIAEHRLVLVGHARVRLGMVSAEAARACLGSLTRAGLLRRDPRFNSKAAPYQITRKGLAVVGSDLPSPRMNLQGYAHDAGLAWLWLAAHAGMFGPLREVISERRMRSHDGSEDGRREPLAVRLGGVGPGGHARLHYPDLLLVEPNGRRIALELELSGKKRTDRERILAGYGADPRIEAVLYLVEKPRIGHDVLTSARKLGIPDRVHVRRVQLADTPPEPGLESARTTARAPARTAARARTGAVAR